MTILTTSTGGSSPSEIQYIHLVTSKHLDLIHQTHHHFHTSTIWRWLLRPAAVQRHHCHRLRGPRQLRWVCPTLATWQKIGQPWAGVTISFLQKWTLKSIPVQDGSSNHQQQTLQTEGNLWRYILIASYSYYSNQQLPFTTVPTFQPWNFKGTRSLCSSDWSTSVKHRSPGEIQ